MLNILMLWPRILSLKICAIAIMATCRLSDIDEGLGIDLHDLISLISGVIDEIIISKFLDFGNSVKTSSDEDVTVFFDVSGHLWIECFCQFLEFIEF
jgi:hypothetical protein